MLSSRIDYVVLPAGEGPGQDRCFTADGLTAGGLVVVLDGASAYDPSASSDAGEYVDNPRAGADRAHHRYARHGPARVPSRRPSGRRRRSMCSNNARNAYDRWIDRLGTTTILGEAC